MKRTLATLTLAALCGAAFANLKVITTTSDLASIAAAVGGSNITVSSIITGSRDAHRIEAKPSYMSRTSSANVFVAIGLDLEVGYERAIIDGSGNSRVAPGAPGHVYASEFCYVLEKPTGAVTRAQGDIHPYGNPHIWLDPYNGRQIAIGLAEKFSNLDKGNAKNYEANLKKFLDRLDSSMFGSAQVDKFGGAQLWSWLRAGELSSKTGGAQMGGWYAKMAPLAGTPVLTYHRSMSYLANRFKLKVVEQLEPKPGLEPTPGHLSKVMREGKEAGVKAVLQEPFFSSRHGQLVASRIGAKVIVLPQSVGQAPGADDYVSLFDVIVARLSELR